MEHGTIGCGIDHARTMGFGRLDSKPLVFHRRQRPKQRKSDAYPVFRQLQLFQWYLLHLSADYYDQLEGRQQIEMDDPFRRRIRKTVQTRKTAGEHVHIGLLSL
jgi:hypothetical protein